jgi:uncharacterized phage protein (TIGR01671 family)
MNNFKYRVWDKISQNLIYDDLSPHYFHIPRSLDGNDIEGEANLHNLSDLLNNPDFVVQQWTGVQDVNGELIFDGDIIENSTNYEEFCSPAVVSMGRYEDVEWSLYSISKEAHGELKKTFSGIDLYEQFPLQYRRSKNYKAIGNIFENIDIFSKPFEKKKKTKVREIYTVVRQYETEKSFCELETHFEKVADEAGEFLYGTASGNEKISVSFEINEENGQGWENIEV